MNTNFFCLSLATVDTDVAITNNFFFLVSCLVGIIKLSAVMFSLCFTQDGIITLFFVMTVTHGIAWVTHMECVRGSCSLAS